MVLWRSWKQWRWYSHVGKVSKTGAFSPLIIFYYDISGQQETELIKGFLVLLAALHIHYLKWASLPEIAYFATVLEYRRFCSQLGAKPLQTTGWLSLSEECYDLPLWIAVGWELQILVASVLSYCPIWDIGKEWLHVVRDQDTHSKMVRTSTHSFWTTETLRVLRTLHVSLPFENTQTVLFK